MERDYRKDLEVCEKASGQLDLITMDRTALPWYIKRCMELQAQLQQAEERENKAFGLMNNFRETATKAVIKTQELKAKLFDREAALRGALEKLLEYQAPYFSAEEMQQNKDAQINAAKLLSSPSQSSRYREALAVVEEARCSSTADGKKCLYDCDKEPCPWNALDISIIALDKAGEGAGE